MLHGMAVITQTPDGATLHLEVAPFTVLNPKDEGEALDSGPVLTWDLAYYPDPLEQPGCAAAPHGPARYPGVDEQTQRQQRAAGALLAERGWAVQYAGERRPHWWTDDDGNRRAVLWGGYGVKVVNLTGEPVTIVEPTAPAVPSSPPAGTIPAEEATARVEWEMTVRNSRTGAMMVAGRCVSGIEGRVPIGVERPRVLGVPDPVQGVAWLVPRDVAAVCTHRDDLVVGSGLAVVDGVSGYTHLTRVVGVATAPEARVAPEKG